MAIEGGFSPQAEIKSLRQQLDCALHNERVKESWWKQQQEESRRLAIENVKLRGALHVIKEWKPPQLLEGSNGERDFFRNIAGEALK